MNPDEPTMIPCGLCGSTAHKVLFKRRSKAFLPAAPRAVITTDTYDDFGTIVRCPECKLVFRNPRPGDTAVIDSYANLEDEAYLSEDNSRAINAHLSLQFIKKFKKTGRLLDVGCFTGHILNAARLNFDTTGVEPSRWAAAMAREKFKLTVFDGAFGDVDLPEEHFDVVSMVDVIEHFSNPLQYLQKAGSVLRKDGVLYIVTPNILSLSARLLGRYWWGLRSAHLYYFSPFTLQEMLRKSGFKIVRMRSYGRMFTYGYWLSRLKNYPFVVRQPITRLINAIGASDKIAYINTFDSIELCAIKTGTEPGENFEKADE